MADTNPFYFGYYPGDRPLYKRPGGPNVPQINLPPGFNLEGSLNSLEYHFDQAVETVNIPRWLKERYIKDFTGKLQVAVTGQKNVDLEEIDRRGPEALEDMPGVAVRMDLNPVEWAKDPGGMAKKTVKGWISNTFDYDDFDRRSRYKLWASMLSDNGSESPDLEDGSFFRKKAVEWEKKSRDAAVSAIEERVMKFADTSSTEAGGVGNLRNVRRDIEMIARGKDPDAHTESLLSLDDPTYRGVKKSILDIQFSSTDFKKRESSYDDFVKASLYAMDDDIKNQVFLLGAMSVNTLDFSDYKNWDEDFAADFTGAMKGYSKNIDWQSAAYRDNIKNLYRHYGITDSQTLEKYADEIQSLHAQAELSRYFDGLEKSIKDAQSNINQFLVAGEDLKVVDSQVDIMAFQKMLGHVEDTDVDAFLSGLDAELAGIKINGASLTPTQVADYKKKVSKRLKVDTKDYSYEGLNQLIDMLPADQQGRVRKDLQRHLDVRRGLKGTRKELSDILGGMDMEAIKKLSIEERQAIRERLQGVLQRGIIGEEITGGDVPLWGRSAQRKYLRAVSDSWYKYDDHERAVGTLASRGNVIYSLVPRLNEERAQNEWDEFFRVLDKGGVKGLADVYLWNRLKAKYKYLTPGYYVEEALKSVNYFGLKIEKARSLTHSVGGVSIKSDYLMTFGGIGFGFLGDSTGRTSSAYANSFNIEFATPAGLKKAKVVGGEHFNFLRNEKFKTQLVNLKLKGQFNPDNFKDLLNASGEADFLAKLAAAGFKLKGDAAKDLYKDFQGYRKWFLANAAKLGGDAHDPNFAYQIFMGLHNTDLKYDHWGISGVIGITTRYAGPLQRVYKYLNALQTKIYDSTLGKVLNVGLNYKELIAEKIARGSLKLLIERGVAKILTWFGSAVTSETGIGPVIMKAIEPLIRYAVKKVMDAGEAVFKAVLKGDFSKLFEEFGNAASAAIKAMMMAAAIPVVMIMFVLFIVMNMLGGFSPVNPAATGGGEYTYGGPPGGGGSGNIAPPCPEPSIPPPSCVFQSSPIISTTSYTSSSETGHGSNSYWSAVGGTTCRWNIPTAASGSPSRGPVNISGNICNNRDPARTYYGYAIDVVTNGCWSVYLPGIADEWSVANAGFATFGSMAVATGYVGGNEAYKMTLLHLGGSSINTGTLSAGDKVAETADWGSNTHVHIELSEWSGGGWSPVRPESVLSCN